MNPELVIEDDRQKSQLLTALTRFATTVGPEAWRTILAVAGVPVAGLRFSASAHSFAYELVAKFVEKPVSLRSESPHPMVKLLSHLLANPDPGDLYGLSEEDITLFQTLILSAAERSIALKMRAAVGKIEDESGKGIGTGVLVGKSLLLTCWHIFEKSDLRQAYVRFGNVSRWDRTIDKGTSYSLKTGTTEIIQRGGGTRPDYALLRIAADVDLPSCPLRDAIPSSGQRIRILHYPKGAFLAISDIGTITQVGPGYITHNIATAPGSSGAPIFDEQWNVIAIHRGDSSLTQSIAPGSTSGVTLEAFWNEIQPHLTA